MKTKIVAALFLLLLARQASADGIKGILGLNFSKYLFSAEFTGLNRQQKSGPAFGLGYAFAINPQMTLEADAIYSAKGAQASFEYAAGKLVAGTYDIDMIAIPIFFQYRLKEGSSPYVAAGPEFNFILSHTLEIPEYSERFDIAKNTNRLILALNVALGYELSLGRWGLFAEARYNRWLSNMLKDPGAPVKSETVTLAAGGILYL